MLGRSKLSLKQFGLQRSGTNYLRYLLERNYRIQVLVNEGGWKHGHYHVPQIVGRELSLIVCTKNPYAWLTSCHRYMMTHPQQTRPASFDAFLTGRFTLHGRVHYHGGEYPIVLRARNPIEHWNSLHFHWLSISLAKEKLYVVRYEDLLHDPEGTLDSYFAQLKQRHAFQIPDRTLSAGWDAQAAEDTLSGTQFSQDRYYREHEYLTEFTPDQLRFVAENLDLEVMRRLQYEVEEERGSI